MLVLSDLSDIEYCPDQILHKMQYYFISKYYIEYQKYYFDHESAGQWLLCQEFPLSRKCTKNQAEENKKC